MLIKKMLEKKITCYEKEFDTWQKAVEASAEPMVKAGIIEPCYVQDIISCVEEHGPYIVIAPDIAMPHASEGATGVNETAIGFMKVEKPVSFDPNDPEKDARLFFVLASTDHDQHLQNMMQLSEMLMNEELVQELLLVQNDEDLEKIGKKYAV